MKQHIYKIIGLPLALSSLIYIGMYIQDNEFKHEVKTEYQFNVDQTGYDIVSDDKYIGRINYGLNPSLDSLIDNDNR